MKPRGGKWDWASWDPRLGTMSDSEIARAMGCSTKTVRERRYFLGVQAFDPGLDWEPWEHLLGKISDEELARRIGTGRVNVLYHRQRLGIPAAPRTTRRVSRSASASPGGSQPTAAARPDVRDAFERWAWAIVERDRLGKRAPDSPAHQRAVAAVQTAKAEALRLERTRAPRVPVGGAG